MVIVAVASVYRTPALLFHDLNWDKSLYRLIGDSLASGHAPYTNVWDHKPVGIFVLLGAAQSVFGESLTAFRMMTSAFVGLTGFLLAMTARAIFPSWPRIGLLAGLLYVFYSTHNAGDGFNTELVFVPAAMAGLLIALKAVQGIPARN